jgi:hypothetical protein
MVEKLRGFTSHGNGSHPFGTRIDDMTFEYEDLLPEAEVVFDEYTQGQDLMDPKTFQCLAEDWGRSNETT